MGARLLGRALPGSQVMAIGRGVAYRPASGYRSGEEDRDGGLEFRILGPFEVVARGEPVKLSPRPRTLLVALLLRPETVSAEQAIELIAARAAATGKSTKSGKPAARKAAPKKAAAKKPAAKSAAKKPAAKSAAKKPAAGKAAAKVAAAEV